MTTRENETPPKFKLGPIQAVSPTLVEVLRACPLRAAFSRRHQLSQFVLSNPKAWLGIAYHNVLEKLWTPVAEEFADEQVIEHLWVAAISTLRKRALAHPLDRRFATPEKWPGYYLVRASLAIRAQEALVNQPRLRSPTDSVKVVGHIREKQLTAMEGKLIGKPDVITSDAIWDYKSGNVYDESPHGAKIVKESYVRQLLLYGYLVNENYGRYPDVGKLLPMQGEAVEIQLEANRCTNEAIQAVSLLDSFNEKLTSSVDVTDLATPSPSACRWCNFKTLCPAFWREVNEDWTEQLGSAAIRGTLKSAPTQIQNGRAFSLSISVLSGRSAPRDITVAPLNKEIHPQLSEFLVGEAVRIINLFLRRDGQLAPTDTTVCVRESECPEFSVDDQQIASLKNAADIDT